MANINNISSLEANLGITQEDLAAFKLPEIALQVGTSEDPLDEFTLSREQVYTNCRNSLDFLAAVAMPTVFQYYYPPVFLMVWSWLTEYVHKVRDFSQLALGLPRGFSKTTVVKLFVLYTILFTKKKFILVMAENQSKANNIISDVVDMLNEANIKSVFGNWRDYIETERQDLKKFSFQQRTVILMAGSIESVRGISLKNERPDVMIFDDIQSRVCAESQVQSETLEREMVGTAMKAKSPHGCLFIFIANMYPTKWSILRKLKHNPNWIKFIAGGILADGTSLWEDLQPIKQLLREYQNDLSMGRPEVFHAEVLNDENASANNFIQLSKLPLYPFQDEDISAGSFIIIDPATHKAGADPVSIGYFEIHNGTPVLRELEEGCLSPGETIRLALGLALKHGTRLVVIESNAYQYTLNYWFNYITQQMGIIGIEAVEIYSGSLSKNSRIISMFRQLLQGELFIHPECTALAHQQIIEFNPMKRDNNDGILDLLTYAPKVIDQYAEFIVSSTVIQQQEFSNIDVPEFNSPF